MAVAAQGNIVATAPLFLQSSWSRTQTQAAAKTWQCDIYNFPWHGLIYRPKQVTDYSATTFILRTSGSSLLPLFYLLHLSGCVWVLDIVCDGVVGERRCDFFRLSAFCRRKCFCTFLHWCKYVSEPDCTHTCPGVCSSICTLLRVLRLWISYTRRF